MGSEIIDVLLRNDILSSTLTPKSSKNTVPQIYILKQEQYAECLASGTFYKPTISKAQVAYSSTMKSSGFNLKIKLNTEPIRTKYHTDIKLCNSFNEDFKAHCETKYKLKEDFSPSFLEALKIMLQEDFDNNNESFFAVLITLYEIDLKKILVNTKDANSISKLIDYARDLTAQNSDVFDDLESRFKA